MEIEGVVRVGGWKETGGGRLRPGQWRSWGGGVGAKCGISHVVRGDY
jgi:hypothetical protein